MAQSWGLAGQLSKRGLIMEVWSRWREPTGLVKHWGLGAVGSGRNLDSGVWSSRRKNDLRAAGHQHPSRLWWSGAHRSTRFHLSSLHAHCLRGFFVVVVGLFCLLVCFCLILPKSKGLLPTVECSRVPTYLPPDLCLNHCWKLGLHHHLPGSHCGLPVPSQKEPCYYMCPTWIIPDNLLILTCLI